MPSASRPPRPAGWSDGTVRRFAARLMHTDQRVAVGEGGGGMVGFGQSTRSAGAPPGPCTDETDTVLIAASSCSTVCGDAGLRCRDSRGRTTGELRQNLAPQGDADDWSWCLPLAAMAGHRLAMATTKDHDRDDKPVPRPAWRRGSSLPVAPRPVVEAAVQRRHLAADVLYPPRAAGQSGLCAACAAGRLPGWGTVTARPCSQVSALRIDQPAPVTWPATCSPTRCRASNAAATGAATRRTSPRRASPTGHT
jgi:hypothetical protein